MPTYLPGLIQLVSCSLHGSLRLSIRWDVINSLGLSAIWIVRHGDLYGAAALTLMPSDHGVRSAFSFWSPVLASDILAKSVSAASWIEMQTPLANSNVAGVCAVFISLSFVLRYKYS